MKEYRICLEGCDEYTVFTMTLSEQEYALLQRVSELSVKMSEYPCMPTLNIKEVEK